MFAKERHSRILNLLNQNGSVTTAELVGSLQVSIETIRRDLLHLEHQGQLQRVHGGAVAPGSMQPYLDLSQRLEANSSAKEALCRTAAQLVEQDDIIFIDCGSTAVFFAKAIAAQGLRLTVVTHSIPVFDILCRQNGIQVVLCGGFYDPSEKGFHGQLTLDMLSKMHVRKAFLCPSAINLKSGIWDYNHSLVHIQAKVASAADRVFFLADSNKFEKTAMLKVCDISSSHAFVTDRSFPQQYKQLYSEHGITVITSEDDLERNI